jgi:hypothetical protein
MKSIDIFVVVGLYRLWSMAEHRKTLGTIRGVGDKLDNGIKDRLDRIEAALAGHLTKE